MEKTQLATFVYSLYRYIMKNMLDSVSLIVECFNENMPRPDWEDNFIKLFRA